SLTTARQGVDFLPLTVDYQEMTYAAGKIPGGFFKREGRPNERETLMSRVVDRSLRPLFPKGYCSETQVIASVLSADMDNGSDVAAMLGASVALEISNIPFKGPIAGVRVGRVAEAFVCNPSAEVMGQSDLDLFLVGRKVTPGTGGRDFDVNLVMLEGAAQEVAEDIIVDAINFGLENLRPVILLQDQMRAEIGKEKRVFTEATLDSEILAKVSDLALAGLKDAFSTPQKQERNTKLREIKELVMKAMASDDGALEAAAAKALDKLERQVLREMILREKRRVDGRSSTDIRPISSEVGLLPRTHGSALFTRGETQALAVLTLGTGSDEQRMDYVGGEERRTFMLHYN
ncbi:MAG: polyribonucleotide nucleotidyltransferase, partial [Deltaproteobacteria bacterium]|nr:polyribonucleotide nucleotidyltransferase [Deltaproteobacteria bacterium]